MFRMKYAMGRCEFEAESVALTLHLRESNEIGDDAAALRQRLEEDGYLLLRELHDRDAVTRTRESILRCLDARGALADDVPFTEGVMNPRYEGPANYSARHNDDLKTAELKALVYGPAIMGFFDRLFEAPAASYQFQWPRAVGSGGFSPVHSDWPFMSRGSSRLLTCWTPLDDIPPEFGPLVICEGSHRWCRVIETYGQSDVDRDSTRCRKRGSILGRGCSVRRLEQARHWADWPSECFNPMTDRSYPQTSWRRILRLALVQIQTTL